MKNVNLNLISINPINFEKLTKMFGVSLRTNLILTKHIDLEIIQHLTGRLLITNFYSDSQIWM